MIFYILVHAVSYLSNGQTDRQTVGDERKKKNKCQRPNSFHSFIAAYTQLRGAWTAKSNNTVIIIGRSRSYTVPNLFKDIFLDKKLTDAKTKQDQFKILKFTDSRRLMPLKLLGVKIEVDNLDLSEVFMC